MPSDPNQLPPADETKVPPTNDPTSAQDDAADDETSDDPVTEASLESFPASDPPAWIDEEN